MSEAEKQGLKESIKAKLLKLAILVVGGVALMLLASLVTYWIESR
jgi:hypothetical protein